MQLKHGWLLLGVLGFFPALAWAEKFPAKNLSVICGGDFMTDSGKWARQFKIIYTSSNGVQTNIYLSNQWSDDCSKLKAKTQAVILAAEEGRVNLDLGTGEIKVVEDESGKPSETQKRADRAKPFSCEYVTSPLQPGRVASVSGCGSSILIAPVKCDDELGNSFTTTVACENVRNKKAIDCYKETITKPKDGQVQMKDVSLDGGKKSQRDAR